MMHFSNFTCLQWRTRESEDEQSNDWVVHDECLPLYCRQSWWCDEAVELREEMSRKECVNSRLVEVGRHPQNARAQMVGTKHE